MLHDFSPFLWRISGDFGVRWYGLSYMVGFILSYYLILWLTRRQNASITQEQISDFVTYGAIGVLVGGRLGYCLFYSPDLFLSFDSNFPFWGVLAVNKGGMASHGGILGLITSCVIFAQRHGMNPLYLFDLVAVCGPVGIFFGRLANFVNGELVGRIAPENYPWGVRFPQDILNWPSQEFVRLGTLSTVVEKLGVTKDQWFEWMDKFRADSVARMNLESTLYKIIDAVQAGNQEVRAAMAPVLDLRYPSQLFAAFGEGVLLFSVLFLFWRNPRKPGMVGALFVVVYALVRISDEQFRLPDAHIGYQLFGLTRGQWLSIGMLALGLLLMLIWGKRSTLPTQGWRRVQSVKIHRRK